MQPVAQQMAYPYSTAKPRPSVGRTRLLALCDEMFLTLCTLHAGLLEQDLADRFNCSMSTVSRICLEWINLVCNIVCCFGVHQHLALKGSH